MNNYVIFFFKPRSHKRILKLLSLSFLLLITGTTIGQESVTSRTARETPEEYFASISQAVAATGLGDTRPLGAPIQSPNETYIILKDCNTPYYDFGMELEEPDYLPTDVAMDLIQFTISMRNMRIPETVWAYHFTVLKVIAVEYIRALRQNPSGKEALTETSYKNLVKEYERLQTSVTNYVKTQSTNPPRIMYTEGCGAGEVSVTIRTVPVGAKVSYIPLFKFKLCEARNIQPGDTKACTGWVNAVKNAEAISGKYVYVANWPDGKSASGVINVNDANGSVATITR